MCFIVLPKPPLQKLLGAAANVQALLDDGTLADAFAKGDGHATQLAVTAFDILSEQAAAVLAEQKEVSPFLRYRKEILGDTPSGAKLRHLVRSLAEECYPYSFNRLFLEADEHHVRIALECIASYTRLGQNDTFFMSLWAEIYEAQSSEVTA